MSDFSLRPPSGGNRNMPPKVHQYYLHSTTKETTAQGRTVEKWRALCAAPYRRHGITGLGLLERKFYTLAIRPVSVACVVTEIQMGYRCVASFPYFWVQYCPTVRASHQSIPRSHTVCSSNSSLELCRTPVCNSLRARSLMHVT